MAARLPFSMAEHEVRPGKRARFELPVARLMSGTPLAIPGIVVHGKHDGPTVWLSAAVHGDEICGVEIIRRVLAAVDEQKLRGTILAIPIVNVHGFNAGDRYLPDRRDLNRAFPGSSRGSLAARVAHLLMSKVVARCTFGIDFHTGSDRRINLPQIRGDLGDPTTKELAAAFAPPLAIDSRLRDGSLRQAATEVGASVLLYEGGEASRFDEASISMGRDGTLRVLRSLGLIDEAPPASSETRWATRSRWLRAGRSGILHLDVGLGSEIERGAEVARILDPFGSTLGRIRARNDGVVIGHTQRPLVNRGDAVAHIAEV